MKQDPFADRNGRGQPTTQRSTDRAAPAPIAAQTFAGCLLQGVAAVLRRVRQATVLPKAYAEARKGEDPRQHGDTLRALLRAMPDLVFFLDRDAVFRDVHAGNASALAMPPDLFLGRPVSEVLPPPLADRFAEVFREAARTGAIQTAEYEMTIGGCPHDFEARVVASEDGFVVVSREVTENKRTEQTLRTSEARYRAIVESSSDMICRYLVDGTLTFVNESYCRFFGRSREELLGRSFLTFLPEEEQGRMRASLATFSPDMAPVVYEHPVLASHGEVRWTVWTNHGATDPVSGHVEYQSVGVDVTDRKRAERALQQSEERYRHLAEENARLLDKARQDAEAKAVLLQEVNHRVKNNLAAIIGLIYAEQRHARDRPGESSNLSGLAGRIEGLARVHGLLSAAGWSPLPLHELVREVVQGALKALPPGKHVALEVDESTVQVTPQQASGLALAMNELITNTMKYGLEGRSSACVTIRIVSEDEQTLLEYRDDGPGYPEDVLQLARRGLGLYLVQNLARHDLRGEITLRNEAGAVAAIRFVPRLHRPSSP